MENFVIESFYVSSYNLYRCCCFYFCRHWWRHWSYAAQWNAPNATRYLIPSYTSTWQSFKHNTAKAGSEWMNETCAVIRSLTCKVCLNQECYFSILSSTCSSGNTQRRICLGRWSRTWDNAVVNLLQCQWLTEYQGDGFVKPVPKWGKIH